MGNDRRLIDGAPVPEDDNARRPGLKRRLKTGLQTKLPALWRVYWRSKQQLKRLWLLRYFAYDVRHSYRAMFWREGHQNRDTLSAALLFQYHKLEKGLVMPGPHRLFGVDPAKASALLARRWVAAGHPRDDAVFVGALEAIVAYVHRLESEGLDPQGRVLPHMRAFLAEIPERNDLLSTPRPLPACSGQGFAQLAQARRSVRDFRPDPVEQELIARAVATAQQSPSACNRQPCRVYVVSDPERKRRLLAHQNGNRGFGDRAPHVAILTAEERGFFDVSERHEPYIDGGLFAMSFILALRDLGVASCCLNWCVPPATDATVHRLFDLPNSQRIVMLLAFGWPPDDCHVPRSPRRSLDEVLRYL